MDNIIFIIKPKGAFECLPNQPTEIKYQLNLLGI